MMTIEVLETGPMASIQDGGRKGYERFGVPSSGPMDHYSFKASNLLVNNPANAAGIEISLMSLRLRCWQSGLVALCGRGFVLYKNRLKMPSWTAIWFRYGDELFFECVSSGWAEVAFSGGVIVPDVLGSKATYARAYLGGINGKNLQNGNRFEVGLPTTDPALMAGASISTEMIPIYAEQAAVGVVLGPHLAHFAPDAVDRFTNTTYRVGFNSDRMGYRLQGEVLPLVRPADILSEGLVMGAVQVPASGLPMVMLADRPATGGYARIGTVISADLPLLVQCTPGQSSIHFYVVDVETAQNKYRQQISALTFAVLASSGTVLADGAGSLE